MEKIESNNKSKSQSATDSRIRRFEEIMSRLNKIEKQLEYITDWLWNHDGHTAEEYAAKVDELRALEIEHENLDKELKIYYRIINPKK